MKVSRNYILKFQVIPGKPASVEGFGILNPYSSQSILSQTCRFAQLLDDDDHWAWKFDTGVLVGNRSGLNQLFVYIYILCLYIFWYTNTCLVYVHITFLPQNRKGTRLNIHMFKSFCFCFHMFDECVCVYLVTTANACWFSGHSKACHMHLALPSVTMCAHRRIVGKTWKALPTKGSDVLMEITRSSNGPNGQECDGKI